MSQNGRWEFDEQGKPHYIPPEGNTGGSGSYQRPVSRKSKSNDTSWHWILIILGFAIFWPVGLALLIAELSGKWKDNTQLNQEVDRAAKAVKNVAKDFSEKYKENQTKANAAQTEARPAQKTAKKQGKKPATKKEKDNGKKYGLGGAAAFRGWGIAIMGIFGFSFVMALIEEIRYFFSLGYLLEMVIPLLAFFLVGLSLFMVGTKRRQKLKLFKKYLSMIGRKESVSIPSLAKVMGRNPKKAMDDLEEMLERGFFEVGYVDAARQCLVLRDEFEEEPQQEPVPEEVLSDSATDATLQKIRSLNDAIENQEVSDKIDQIEVLTGKILRLLEERPEKASELRGFMNYYLPQTLKILENYATLEAQGIQGENIVTAKQKIEGMMDKMVEGYETQLDKLFEGDVLDISADLKVMESMLEKDGLSMENELRF